MSLNALYQFNGLGQQLDSAEAVMTGATLKALNPVIANQQRAAGLNQNPGIYNNFITWQVGFTFQMPLGMRSPLANTRQAQYILLRARAYLQQVVHQTTHSLARFFLEIDANYKQFKTASRLRAAAAQRLDAQRAYYEEGRITIDRFLDAVSQYATAVATEAQYKTTYNISIVALEEAKGTLLAYDNIAVAEGPHPRKAYIQARDIQGAHRQFHISPDGPMVPEKPVGPANPDTSRRPIRRPTPTSRNCRPCPPRSARSARPRPRCRPTCRPRPSRSSRRTRPARATEPRRRTPRRPEPSPAARPAPASEMTLTSGDGAPPWPRTASSAAGDRIAASGGRSATAARSAVRAPRRVARRPPPRVRRGTAGRPRRGQRRPPPAGRRSSSAPPPDDLPPLPRQRSSCRRRPDSDPDRRAR